MNQTVTFGLINRDEFLKECADSYSLYLPLKGNGFHFCTMGKYIGLYCGTATGGKMFVLANIHVLILYVLGARKYI